MSRWVINESANLVSLIKSLSEGSKHSLAARLVQSAIEMSQNNEKIPISAIDVLQMAQYASVDDWSFLEGLLT
jgi:hypothetical protein